MYLAILAVLFGSALLLEWRFNIHLYDTRRERILVTVLFFVIGVAWDTFSVIEKTWIFPGNGLVGIWIGVLPLEEYLFFLVVPYWILTVYKLIDAKLHIADGQRRTM